MTQQRLFAETETLRRADRASFLKAFARAGAEGYWDHSLSEFEGERVGPEPDPVGRKFTASCSECGAYVEVRPYKSGYPPIGGPAVSLKCSPDRDFSNETEGSPGESEANSEPGD